MTNLALIAHPRSVGFRRGRSAWGAGTFLLLCFSMLVLAFLSMPGLAGQGDELVREPLEIRSASGVHRFEVEIADTPQARSFGLMHRQHLASDAGMLFDFKEDREVAFWMKNTLISLDMLFIDRTGRIAHIAADTVPLSEDLVPSREVVRFVLEVPAGTSAALGIAPGDMATSATIKAAAAD
ncbi:DUF192 domain-containing protein [Stappia sp.]|uniref:DUF192 domain-containing protein n=1 Tax=Stappia sp. TaxID=1870903 RepID=UPI003D0E541C